MTVSTSPDDAQAGQTAEEAAEDQRQQAMDETVRLETLGREAAAAVHRLEAFPKIGLESIRGLRSRRRSSRRGAGNGHDGLRLAAWEALRQLAGFDPDGLVAGGEGGSAGAGAGTAVATGQSGRLGARSSHRQRRHRRSTFGTGTGHRSIARRRASRSRRSSLMPHRKSGGMGAMLARRGEGWDDEDEDEDEDGSSSDSDSESSGGSKGGVNEGHRRARLRDSTGGLKHAPTSAAHPGKIDHRTSSSSSSSSSRAIGTTGSKQGASHDGATRVHSKAARSLSVAASGHPSDARAGSGIEQGRHDSEDATPNGIMGVAPNELFRGDGAAHTESEAFGMSHGDVRNRSGGQADIPGAEWASDSDSVSDGPAADNSQSKVNADPLRHPCPVLRVPRPHVDLAPLDVSAAGALDALQQADSLALHRVTVCDYGMTAMQRDWWAAATGVTNDGPLCVAVSHARPDPIRIARGGEDADDSPGDVRNTNSTDVGAIDNRNQSGRSSVMDREGPFIG